MIGIWQSYSNIYLYVAGVAMLLTFGIPLLVVPLRWAQAFRWQVPRPENLVVFLGRSMGIIISLLAIFSIEAARTPEVQPFFFDLMLWTFFSMLALHIYGAIRKTQPITETVEIALWILLFLVTLCFYPT